MVRTAAAIANTGRRNQRLRPKRTADCRDVGSGGQGPGRGMWRRSLDRSLVRTAAADAGSGGLAPTRNVAALELTRQPGSSRKFRRRYTQGMAVVYVRVPSDLHQALKARAQSDGKTLNGMCRDALSRLVGTTILDADPRSNTLAPSDPRGHTLAPPAAPPADYGLNGPLPS